MGRPSQAVLDRIAAADVFETGVPIGDGKYQLVLKKIFFGEKRKGLIFIAEHDVVTAEKTESGVEPNPVGGRADYAVAFYGNGADMADGNVKQYILQGFLGEELAKKGTPLRAAQDQRVGKILGEMTDDAQPGRGMLVGCLAFTKPQAKDKTKDFTHHTWSKVEQTEVEIAKRRADLGELVLDAPETSGAAPAAPPPPGAAPAPPAPAAFVPPAPWRVHPDPKAGRAPDGGPWYWDGGNGVKSAADIRAGK